MMKINLRMLTLSVACFAIFSIWAQDSVLVKEVTVSQEYNPTVKDAFKIGTSPTVDAPASYTPTFEYSFFNAPLRTTYDIQFIGADEFFSPESMPVGKQNYIKGGVGNYLTIYGELFYNAYNSEEQNVNIFYKNRSSWGDVTLQDGSKVDAPMITNYGKIDFQRRYRRSILNSAVAFDRKGYEYYGYNTLEEGAKHVYWDENGIEIVPDEAKQTLTNVGFNLDLKSLPRRGSDVDYNVGLIFNTASNDDKFSENQFDLTATVDKYLKKLDVGFDAAVTVGFYGGENAVEGTAFAYVGETYFDAKLSPYVSLKKKNWNLKAGANVEMFQSDGNQEIVVAPLVDFNFNIVPKYFTGYMTSNGGIKKNTYAEVMAENLFVVNNIERKSTKTLVDFGGGFIGHPTKALSMKLGIDYKIIQDQLFYVNQIVDDINFSGDYDYYTSRFVAEYDDINVLGFHGEANYNSFKRWSASLAFDYYSYSLETMPAAWNMPEYKISAFGHYNVNEKIRLKGTFAFIPERAVKLPNDMIDYLPVSYDLSLNGEYKFKENLSFFLDVNNMLGSSYYHFNGYPAYRFNALIGATFRF